MATGDIIQKDLGLVTAYGYALAGGYTGSEEQFKKDFAALMSGQYSALGNKPSINGVTLVGNKTTEDLGIQSTVEVKSYYYIRNEVTHKWNNPFECATDNAVLNRWSVYAYGNVSYLDFDITTTKSVTLTPVRNNPIRFYASMEDGIVSDDIYLSLCPRNSIFSDTPAGVMGLSTDFNNFGNYARPFFATYAGDKPEVQIALNGSNLIDDSITFDADTRCVISAMFLNRIGWKSWED